MRLSPPNSKNRPSGVPPERQEKGRQSPAVRRCLFSIILRWKRKSISVSFFDWKMLMIELRGYIDESGNKRFAQWLEGLDALAAAKVTIALSRIEQGNFSKVKGVGSGVFEYKIDFGPGYRIYFGKDGGRIVILVGGGTKKRQTQDIAEAQECWATYKRRKRQEIQ
jgi:putative addiction module killer protein